MLEVYTDGACVPNPGFGSWAFVKLLNGKVIVEKSGSVESTTNNRMEIQAFIEALKEIDIKDDVVVYSDSMLLVKTYNEWMHNWEAKAWKRGKVKNLDLVTELWLLKKHYTNLQLEWVRGHDGNRWNERADELCDLHIQEALINGKIDHKVYMKIKRYETRLFKN